MIAFDNETLEVAGFINSIFFDKFWTLLVEETNGYARQKSHNNQSRVQSGISDWIDTALKENKSFFGLLLHMGTCRKPRIEDYWSTNNMFQPEFWSLS